MKLTNALIAATQTPPKGKRVELKDDASSGLTLRMSSTAAAWSVAYRPIGGKMQRQTLGRYPEVSLALAREKAAEILLAKGAGRNPAKEKRVAVTRDRLTFDALADDFVRLYVERRKAPRSVKDDKWLLGIARAAWGAKAATTISRGDVAALLDDVAVRGGVLSNRVRAVLSKLFSWALERDAVAVNPVAGTTRRQKEAPKSRALTEAEATLFLETLNDPAVPCELGVALALQMILATGGRPGEVAGMTYAELSLDGPCPVWSLSATRSKSGRERVIPLSKFALSIIERARKVGASRPGGAGCVFPSRYMGAAPLARHSLSQALPAVRAVDDLAPFVPHDLRRTSATIAGDLGASKAAIGLLLGHAPAGVTQRVYSRSERAGEVRAAVDAIGAYLEGLITKRAAEREAARRQERQKAAG